MSYNFYEENAYALAERVNIDGQSISFEFRTFAEDALLFFNGNPVTRDHVSVYLKSGLLYYVCPVGGGGRTRTLTMPTPIKVNTGKMVKVRVDKDEKACFLELNGQQHDVPIDSSTNTAPIDLANTDVYIGGVTPKMVKEVWPEAIVFDSYLGCIKNVQMETVSINFQTMQKYGVKPGCSDSPIQVASFDGRGFVEMNGFPMERSAELIFAFRTLANSGLLLMSTFEGQNDYDFKKNENVSHNNLRECI